MKNHKAKTLAVLGYHQIGEPEEWESWFYVSEDNFSSQLKYLREAGWHVLDLPTFLAGLKNPKGLSERSALITFDDGCQRFLDTAMRWLRFYRYPSVHFVPTDYIGKYNSFDMGNEPKERILNWTELRKLERWGVSIESHAVTHRPFSKITMKQRVEEVRGSKSILEAVLKKTINVFAFPEGDEGSDRVAVRRALREAGYSAAFLYGGGPLKFPVAAPYRLTRLAIGADTNIETLLSNDSQRHSAR
jgi:peptidoglycan/xylan/chitin deacetylase (PgdA/CDA1 family)